MTHTLTIRPAWTPVTIILMVAGFLIAWPIGLMVLAYILWGDRIPEFGQRAEAFRPAPRRSHNERRNDSGNLAFDEYRQRELKRLDEERRRLDEERREFEAYARDLRRAKDQEEFSRFMDERRNRDRGDEAIAL